MPIALGTIVALAAIVFTLTGNIVGVFFLMPLSIITWFVFIRPTHRKRYRAAIADLPRWDLRADSRRSRGRLVQPERRALVVAAEPEVAEPRDRRLVALHVGVVDRAAELADARRRRLDVVDAEEQVRRPPGSPGCSPPGVPPVSITKPPPPGPGSICQPNRPV